MSRISTLISVKLLAEKIASNQSNVRVLDCSWHLPSSKRVARNEYLQQHIPGALFFDIDECCSHETDLPHMLPSAKQFEDYVGNLGINNNTHVIVYDTNENFGIFSAQRCWWNFRVFGHSAISILDGGLCQWSKEGHSLTSEIPKVERQIFKAIFNPSLVWRFEDVEKNIQTKHHQLVDARASGRFHGTAPEPRADTKPGHIPGSLNIPFHNVMNKTTKTWKSPEELRKMFADFEVDLEKPVTFSCGSGVTACTLAVAANLCGKDDVQIYDGSWTEWFRRANPEQMEDVPDEIPE
ncbi:thiosulfate sulfurtransferase-like [Lingula anatina]|uniref:Sulfurtransferase n=1 Tax=Lingula anatina TaxID=7574 RepID=A0A1S3KEA2_LINAN|nr:thiosulfate sulfurtransferase-like [Lingula anatina]|eukprot:XP_013420960.1 thiosulfate sulfurtransferase-like [Lingula anatina]